MNYWRLVIGFIVALVILFSPVSVQAASSSSVTQSILNKGEGEDFSEKNLIRAEFTNRVFKNTNFNKADLRGALFNGVFLDGANLSEIDFSSGISYVSRFKNVSLANAVLSNANMLQSTFDNVDVTGADFSEALLDRQQVNKLCVNASGTNPKTGVSTRESLGCK